LKGRYFHIEVQNNGVVSFANGIGGGSGGLQATDPHGEALFPFFDE
jgi:shikimate 5-dehydrogenase